MARGTRRFGAVLVVSAMLVAGCTGSDGSDGSDGSPPSTTEAAGPGSGAKATGEFATDLDVQVDPDEEAVATTLTVEPGTEEVMVSGAEPKQRISLVDSGSHRLIVLKADKFGQAHFAYLPAELGEFQTGAKATLPYADGFIVEPSKGYTVRSEDTDPVQVSEPFSVLGRDDHPEPSFYDDQVDEIGPTGDEQDWFGYITTRDGVQLSAKVNLPGPAADGPYPTVVEYSGYGISNPDALEPGSMIAGLLGYATVGVNMRGTGCSGGVFDVFNTAQQVDGYDAIEAVARQGWVQDQKVGMVGLSYSGIAQLYAAATQPPSLEAVTPLSVIKDPWLEQWPGGVYNGGFTKQWLAQRDAQAQAGGSSWVSQLVDDGDETCAANLERREQNIDFQAFGEALVHRPTLTAGRDLAELVKKIEVPVYLTGAWQDEQTGPQFADMLGNFEKAPLTRFTMFNGRHPDGYTPLNLSRWYEFLELYVHKQVPRLSDGIRDAASKLFASQFGVEGLTFEPDRFADFDDDDYDGVRAAYERQQPVRILFDMGAGGEVAGAPVPTYEQSYDQWPPADIDERSFYLDDDGALSDEEPGGAGVDRFANDPDSASVDFFGDEGYELLAPTWDFDWTRFADGDAVSYLSAPFESDTVLGGPGYAELYAQVPDGDADVQVSLSLINADDTEWHVTSGLLRLSDRKVDEETSAGLQIDRTYSAADAQDMPADAFEPVKVAIPSFAQTFRKGDRLLVTVSSPGRDFGAWTFSDIGKDGTARDIGWGEDHPSRLVVGVLPGIGDVPPLVAECPSLRGQACRPYEARTNNAAE